MIVRISAKLGRKIHVSPDSVLPADPNPFGDWSAHLLTADRIQYILITNTASLFSMVMFGRGSTDAGSFLDRMTSCMSDFIRATGHGHVFERLIVPSLDRMLFSRALSRSVTGSMNELVFHAQMRLVEDRMSPYDVSLYLNEMPMSSLEHITPIDSFRHLTADGIRAHSRE